MSTSPSQPASSRPSVIQLSIKEKAALSAAYIPLYTDGGIFIPSSRDYRIGDAVYVLLSLPDDPQRYPVVTNPLGGTVSIVDTASLNVVSTITTNLNPWTVLEGAISTASTSGTPSITTVSPRFAVRSSATQTLTVTGTNFSSTSTVTISPSTGITVQSVSCTTTSCSVKAILSSSAPTSSKSLTITNPDGQSATASNAFMIAR